MKSYHPQRQLWLLVALTTIGTVGIALPYPIFAPLLLHPEHGSIIPEFWPTNSRAIVFGLLLAMYPLGLFLGSPVLGGLSDHYGRRKLIVSSLFCATLGYILTALALHINNVYLLLFSRLFTGFVESNIAILRSAVADMPDINKHRAFGLIGGGATLGYVIGPLLGGALSDPHVVSWFTFDTPFYFSAFVVLIAAILACITLHESPKRWHNKNQRGNKRVFVALIQHFNILGQLRYLCRNHSLKLLFISGFCFFFAVDTYYEFYPAYLVKQWSMGTLDIALLTAVLSLGIALGNIWLSRFLSERFAIMPTIFWHIILYAAMLIATLLISQTILLYVVFALTGIFIGVTSNHLYVHISKTASEDQQGKALGMATGLRMLGDATISFAGGFLIIASASLPLFAAIIMAVVAALMVQFFKKSC